MEMAQYLLKFKGRYRILPELDLGTNDFPRDKNGEISKEYDDIYIACQYGNRIYNYGKGILYAYIPSIGRGRNIRKALDKQGILYTDYNETDEEVEFKFKAKDIEPIATLLKAKTNGANISPFSKKNLPKAKDVEIPLDEKKVIYLSYIDLQIHFWILYFKELLENLRVILIIKQI